MTKQQEHISKFISLILRHKPEAVGISLDSQGWADVQELMDGMKEQGKSVELSDLEIVVDNDSKGRYSFNDDKSKIRANQGHSVNGVDLNLKPLSSKDVPDWLYHGTNSRFVESILAEGLKPMGRHHVHLSDNIETANNVGSRRKKKDTDTKIFKISTTEAMNAGIVFYKSANGVYLADSIPAWLLR